MDEPNAPIIRAAETPEAYEAFGRLCRAYFEWCRGRYADMPWLVEAIFGHQSFDDELDALSTRYGPPEGRALIATRAGAPVACGAFHHLSDTACELKRTFVTDGARGLGLGRTLTKALMAAAAEAGFATVRLDTAMRLTEAITLYESMGFARIPPYRQYPDRLLPHLVFMEKAL